jgi:hypothetical protein
MQQSSPQALLVDHWTKTRDSIAASLRLECVGNVRKQELGSRLSISDAVYSAMISGHPHFHFATCVGNILGKSAHTSKMNSCRITWALEFTGRKMQDMAVSSQDAVLLHSSTSTFQALSGCADPLFNGVAGSFVRAKPPRPNRLR